MTPHDRDQEEARQAWIDDLDACAGCLFDMGRCRHPDKPKWDWQREHRDRLVACSRYNVVDKAEEIAASAWDVWF